MRDVPVEMPNEKDKLPSESGTRDRRINATYNDKNTPVIYDHIVFPNKQDLIRLKKKYGENFRKKTEYCVYCYSIFDLGIPAQRKLIRDNVCTMCRKYLGHITTEKNRIADENLQRYNETVSDIEEERYILIKDEVIHYRNKKIEIQFKYRRSNRKLNKISDEKLAEEIREEMADIKQEMDRLVELITMKEGQLKQIARRIIRKDQKMLFKKYGTLQQIAKLLDIDDPEILDLNFILDGITGEEYFRIIPKIDGLGIGNIKVFFDEGNAGTLEYYDERKKMKVIKLIKRVYRVD